MPRGVSKKREREYAELVAEFRREGSYKGREEEVAARIINKQRAQLGETQAARARGAGGRAPDRGLPIEGYERLTVAEISARLPRLSAQDVKKIQSYERRHKHRKTLLDRLDRRVSGAAARGRASSRGGASGRAERRPAAPAARA